MRRKDFLNIAEAKRRADELKAVREKDAAYKAARKKFDNNQIGVRDYDFETEAKQNYKRDIYRRTNYSSW
jgi:hypothetical protein